MVIDGLVQITEPIVHAMLYVLRILVKVLSVIEDVLIGLKDAMMEMIKLR